MLRIGPEITMSRTPNPPPSRSPAAPEAAEDPYLIGRRIGTRLGMMYGTAIATVVLFAAVLGARILGRGEAPADPSSARALSAALDGAAAPSVERDAP